MKAILVPLDGSSCALAALPVAAAIAQRSGATLHLVTAHEEPGLNQPPAMPAALNTWMQEREQSLRAEAVRLERESGVTVKWAFVHGRTAPALAGYVREHAVDLVVMATHGRSGLGRAWLGSTTDALLRVCEAPLLLIRPAVAASTGAYRHILFAVDGSAAAGRALDVAAQLTPHGACTLLHVVTPPSHYPSHYIPDTRDRERAELDRRRAAATKGLDAMAERAHDQGLRPIAKLITADKVAATILREAEQSGADLIALGTHGRGPVLRAILGSVADKVIRSAGVPVLVVPAAAVA